MVLLLTRPRMNRRTISWSGNAASHTCTTHSEKSLRTCCSRRESASGERRPDAQNLPIDSYERLRASLVPLLDSGLWHAILANYHVDPAPKMGREPTRPSASWPLSNQDGPTFRASAAPWNFMRQSVHYDDSSGVTYEHAAMLLLVSSRKPRRFAAFPARDGQILITSGCEDSLAGTAPTSVRRRLACPPRSKLENERWKRRS